jgi:hypothetical protein
MGGVTLLTLLPLLPIRSIFAFLQIEEGIVRVQRMLEIFLSLPYSPDVPIHHVLIVQSDGLT